MAIKVILGIGKESVNCLLIIFIAFFRCFKDATALPDKKHPKIIFVQQLNMIF
jgi:hypothetical protein